MNFAFSQNFVMKMTVREAKEDTLISRDSVKVIWGIDNERNVCLIIDGEKEYCYYKWNHRYKKHCSKKVRKLVSRLITTNVKHDKHVKINGLYVNQWYELYYIRIEIGEGIIIVINRVDDIYPYYFLMW